MSAGMSRHALPDLAPPSHEETIELHELGVSTCANPGLCEHRWRFHSGPWTCEHNHPSPDLSLPADTAARRRLTFLQEAVLAALRELRAQWRPPGDIAGGPRWFRIADVFDHLHDEDDVSVAYEDIRDTLRELRTLGWALDAGHGQMWRAAA